MKSFLQVGWAGLISLAAWASGSDLQAAAGDSDTSQIQVAGNLEAVIPSQLTSLLLGNPTVKFLVTVNEEGRLVDYLALEATHHELLTRAEKILQEAVFSPGRALGKAVQASGEITVYFFDPEQRALRYGLTARPFGSTSMEFASRRVYESSQDLYRYRLAQPVELDRAVELREVKLMVLPDGRGQPAAGECVVEFYIDRRGDVRAPRVVTSANNTVALSALLTLQHTHYAPITRDGGVPAYVKVRLPMSFAPPADPKPVAK